MSYTTFRNSVTINQNRLDKRYLNHFDSDSLLDRLSRAFCNEDFISKKEFCESIEVVKILQRFIKVDREIILYDICGGHGMVGILLAIMCYGVKKTFIIDVKKPDSYEKILSCVSKTEPEKLNKIAYVQDNFNSINYEPNAFLIGIHACGIRSDNIVDLAIGKRLSAAILPCCYKKICLPDELKKFAQTYQLEHLVDINRIIRANNSGYKVKLRTIPKEVTPKNKLFVIMPAE